MSSKQRRLYDPIGVEPEPFIIPLDERHIGECKELWRTRFGGVEEHTDNWLADARIESDKPTQGFVCCHRGRVVGFGIATVGDAEYSRDYIGVDVGLEPWDWNGLLHILVVARDYEGRGIGSDLVAHRLQWLRTTDAEGVFGVSWHRENYRDSRPIFEKFGFERVETVPEYYAKLDGPAPCVDCEDSCRCDATIYRLPFEGKRRALRSDGGFTSLVEPGGDQG